jgi:hypothetical protein
MSPLLSWVALLATTGLLWTTVTHAGNALDRRLLDREDES